MNIESKAKPFPSPTPTYSALQQETFRVLIGWASDHWSLQVRSSASSATPEQHLQAIRDCRAEVASRSAFTPVNPVTEIPEDQLVRAIKGRSDYAYIEKEAVRMGGSCRIVLVNLKEVLAFQSLVRVDHFESWQPEALSNEQLYELCFPSPRNVPEDEVTIERDEQGITISTLDPNIRVLPWHLIPDAAPRIDFQLQYSPDTSPLNMQLLPFPLIRVPNDITIVHYQDRYILRNGYTRAANILSKGIDTIPCILIETNNPALIGVKPGMLDLATLLDTHPPRLTDFWDDTVTCVLKRPALRYIYRVSVNMLAVPR